MSTALLILLAFLLLLPLTKMPRPCISGFYTPDGSGSASPDRDESLGREDARALELSPCSHDRIMLMMRSCPMPSRGECEGGGGRGEDAESRDWD